MAKKIIPIYKIGQHCGTPMPDYFKIASFDDTICTATEFLEQHRHEYYEIVWLKKGKGTHFIDTHSYPYSGSVIFLLAPGQVHRLHQKEKAEGHVLKFLPSIFRDQKDVDEFVMDMGLFENVVAHPVIQLTASQYPVFEEIFSKITIEFNTDEAGKEHVLSAYVKILLTYINRLKQGQLKIENHRGDFNYELFRNYKITIEKNFRMEHSVQVYAKNLLTQARTLNSISRKYAGKSASKLITDRIVLEAKRSLHHGTESMKEIAYGLGFEDPAYFTRFFKKHVGVAPHQYKLQEVFHQQKNTTA